MTYYKQKSFSKTNPYSYIYIYYIHNHFHIAVWKPLFPVTVRSKKRANDRFFFLESSYKIIEKAFLIHVKPTLKLYNFEAKKYTRQSSTQNPKFGQPKPKSRVSFYMYFLPIIYSLFNISWWAYYFRLCRYYIFH